jgi:hypothetical protein
MSKISDRTPDAYLTSSIMLPWPAVEGINLQTMISTVLAASRYATNPEMWANLNLKKLASLAACAVLAQCSPVSDSADGPVVDVGYARFRGAVSYNDTAAYLGVPYAQSPTGERRFRAPVPLNTQKTSSSIVDASEYPEPCIQGSTGGGCTCIACL